MFRLALFSTFTCLPAVLAHNWLLYPQPRTPGQLYGGNSLSLDNCENKDQSVPDINIFQRGQRISAQHTYANHISGFVRFSILPMGQEGSVKAMNDPVNFLTIGCHTNNCGGRINGLNDPAYDYFKPYNLAKQEGIPLDFISPENACNTSVTFPSYLADGDYVLQWIVYGMRGNFAPHPEAMALPFYRNCANIRIAHGDPLTKKPQGKCNFAFHGGDRTLSKISNVNDIQESDLDSSQCSYWRHNSINATADYYNPPNFWGMGEAGLPQTDQTALRAGPPAEVLACGNQMQRFASASLLSNNATYTSGNASSQTQNATLSESDIAPGIQLNDLSDRNPGEGDISVLPDGKVKCNGKHGKAIRKRILFGTA